MPTLHVNGDKTGEEVVFVGWNMAKQIAIDMDDHIWQVDGWFDADGDELTNRFINPDQLARDNTYNVNDEEWEYVSFVSVWYDFPEGRKWAALYPDDFDRTSEG